MIRKRDFGEILENFLAAGHLVFVETLPFSEKKNFFQQICPVYSREIFFGGLSVKNTKTKD